MDIDIGLIQAQEMAEVEVALRRAAALDLDDRFAFELGRPRQSRDDHALTVPVTAYIGVQRFEDFRVDLAPPREDIPTETATFTFSPLGIPELDSAPQVDVIGIEQQIAEKVCAMFERRQGTYSSRARDLADIAGIALQIDGIDGTVLTGAMHREAVRRTETLVDGLPQGFALGEGQAEEWRRRWGSLVRQAPMNFEAALHQAATFLDPVLGGDVGGCRWSPTEGLWE